MDYKFKPYVPMQHQQQATQRQQKRSASRSTLAPTSTTNVGGLLLPSSVAGHGYSRAEDKFIPPIISTRDENPSSNFPTPEGCLGFCPPTSGNPVAHTDFAIDFAINFQDTSWEPSCQDYGYKGDELRNMLLAAIATRPLTSELNIEREAYNINTSEEERNTEISSAEHTWSPDTKTTPSTASSISTPSATSPHCQKQICRNQDAFIDSNDSMQDTSPQIADLDLSDAMSHAALSGENHPVLESQEPSSSTPGNRRVSLDDMKLRAVAAAANSMLPGTTESTITTEPSSVISSSIKRPFSEGGASNNSQLSSSDVCHLSKRLKLTSASVEKAMSALLDAQKTISSIGAELYQNQPDSLMPYVSAQSIANTIEVAPDTVGGDSSDDSSNGLSYDDNESEIEVTTSQPRRSQQRSTQRRRWTKKEEKLLRALKATQKRNAGSPSDYQIANKLDRTESGVKQHWDIMLQREQKDREKY
ncbi:hypothetical protein FOMG_16472 [Fusarium oxysporum f. sp. melonis 26406]|uniref:Myb-like domain-containing protein n=1 Tax=Fusarium oxysporum f. sp. melonis 26406 TaxID=1089452 RepID=W9Z5I9_FUSOX|nr:hypothetical protein FOMG_16472 [Fusarium oxysporum f. sp. melonis 26406]